MRLVLPHQAHGQKRVVLRGEIMVERALIETYRLRQFTHADRMIAACRERRCQRTDDLSLTVRHDTQKRHARKIGKIAVFRYRAARCCCPRWHRPLSAWRAPSQRGALRICPEAGRKLAALHPCRPGTGYAAIGGYRRRSSHRSQEAAEPIFDDVPRL